MNSMATSATILLFVITIWIGLAVGGDPTVQITFFKLDSKVIDNPYMGTWIGEIEDGQILSMKAPVKKDLPSDMMMKGSLQFGEDSIGETEMTLCECFDDETFGKDVVAAGIPKNKFPNNCPITANSDYVISKYKFPTEKLPSGLPDGKIVADLIIFEPGKDPIVTIHCEGELIHKVPVAGR